MTSNCSLVNLVYICAKRFSLRLLVYRSCDRNQRRACLIVTRLLRATLKCLWVENVTCDEPNTMLIDRSHSEDLDFKCDTPTTWFNIKSGLLGCFPLFRKKFLKFRFQFLSGKSCSIWSQLSSWCTSHDRNPPMASQRGYSGFQVTGMIKGFFWVWNFCFQEFSWVRKFGKYFWGGLI